MKLFDDAADILRSGAFANEGQNGIPGDFPQAKRQLIGLNSKS